MGTAVNEFLHRGALDRRGQKVKVIQGSGPESTEHYEPSNLHVVRKQLPVVEYDGTITRPG